MTPDERFERIESNLDKLVEAQLRLTESVSSLTASVAAFVQDSHARTRRLEENLDALIRAITTEHKNGKQKG